MTFNKVTGYKKKFHCKLKLKQTRKRFHNCFIVLLVLLCPRVVFFMLFNFFLREFLMFLEPVLLAPFLVDVNKRAA